MTPGEPVTHPAPQLPATVVPLTKWEREYAAFRRLLPGLLKTHRGQYVVIHNEQVVDSGPDDLALALSFFAKHGNVSIHVGMVSDDPAAVIRIPKYRKME